MLPVALLSLSLDSNYNQPFTRDSFASCPRLRELDMTKCAAFHHSLSSAVLPVSLQVLRLNRKIAVAESSNLPSNIRIQR
jgi:hypothetical protein